MTEAAANEHFRSMAHRATAHWDSLGIDLRGYNTVENATDLDELRQALDLPKISLLGFSYGTHLGQTYLKYFGDYVDRAVLIGVEGLGQTFKLPQTLDGQFNKLAALVAADPEVRNDIPDLLALYDRVSAKLTAEPAVVEVTHPVTRQPVSVPIGKFGLDMILLRDIGDASDLPVFPRLLHTIDQGDYSVLQWFVEKRYRSALGLSAMNIATDLASGAEPVRLELIRAQAESSRFGNVITTPFLALSEVWPVPPLGADFRSPFTTSVPVLLLSGTLDNNTPPYQAEQLRWSLPNAHHIIVRNAGHEQIMYHPAVLRAMVDFLRGEEVGAVTAAYPPLRFIPVRGSRKGVSHPAIGR